MSWTPEQIAPETVRAVRPDAGRLVEEVLDAVRQENPVYADVLGGPEGVGIRLGIEQAVKSFLDAIERGERPSAETGEIWRRLGEAEFQAGRGLDALRAAFRTGVRAAWRGAAELASEAGVPTESVIALAEAIFVYSDELTNDVLEGYIRIQSDEASERERRRRRLAALLLEAEGQDPEATRHAAELARWPVPRTLALVALPGEAPGPVARRLDIDVLAGADQAGAFLVIPDPDAPRRARALAGAVAGTPAAIGPSVPPVEAHRSLRWAREALALVESGTIAGPSPIRASEHLATLIVMRDRELAAALVSERLGPVLALGEPERERLLETLDAWLEHQRHTPRIAAQLHVHPQTVRYRLAKLRDLLSGALETGDGRFELQLALRARTGLGA